MIARLWVFFWWWLLYHGSENPVALWKERAEMDRKLKDLD